MRLLKAIITWKKRIETSDIKLVKVTSSGAFYMKSEDLFNDKKESLDLLDKLNESVNKYKEARR